MDSPPYAHDGQRFYFKKMAIKIITPTQEINQPNAMNNIKRRALYSINQFFNFSQLISNLRPLVMGEIHFFIIRQSIYQNKYYLIIGQNQNFSLVIFEYLGIVITDHFNFENKRTLSVPEKRFQ